jgi:hypothetical protein
MKLIDVCLALLVYQTHSAVETMNGFLLNSNNNYIKSLRQEIVLFWGDMLHSND